MKEIHRPADWVDLVERWPDPDAEMNRQFDWEFKTPNPQRRLRWSRRANPVAPGWRWDGRSGCGGGPTGSRNGGHGQVPQRLGRWVGAALAVVGLSAERALKEAAIRDDMIRVAHRAGASLRKLAEVSGLDRKTVTDIVKTDPLGT